ncbi:hypothetical protein BS47DRAFT_1392872 [Hydnum rufescens UP504]|uniref:Uncharacterized protein n=1 Tax=Hydnum rufescens UP504 TaxID=1448309 RepID=A0A9P6AY20_9AGAM|nr:hypothetical protein BS47DRAFT_1392872 [Hydnum rufescens UP504]
MWVQNEFVVECGVTLWHGSDDRATADPGICRLLSPEMSTVESTFSASSEPYNTTESVFDAHEMTFDRDGDYYVDKETEIDELKDRVIELEDEYVPGTMPGNALGNMPGKTPGNTPGNTTGSPHQAQLERERNLRSSAEKHVETLLEITKKRSFSKSSQDYMRDLQERIRQYQHDLEDAKEEVDYWKNGLKELITRADCGIQGVTIHDQTSALNDA